MKLNGQHMAPQIGPWVNIEDRLPEEGVVVLGIAWYGGLPAVAFLRWEECDDCEGIVWKNGFDEDVMPEPEAWAECRFTVPIGSGDDHGVARFDGSFDPEMN